MLELLSQVLSIEENITETKSSQVKSDEIFVFVERGKPGHLRKTSRSRVDNRQTQLTYRVESRIEHGQHRWKANALITAPILL